MSSDGVPPSTPTDLFGQLSLFGQSSPLAQLREFDQFSPMFGRRPSSITTQSWQLTVESGEVCAGITR
jgi:hypothetical protein